MTEIGSREPMENLTMAYGAFVVQKDLTFSIDRGDIFVIMGGSGCGKSTLLRHLIGLQAPAAGKVYYPGACGMPSLRSGERFSGRSACSTSPGPCSRR
jgi:ABC-type transporter Mla maintaining outer membrane lipid asymmetry ATPase subunit MlaF